ncbi:MAG: hypothetical protein ISS36_01325 [Candidatus Aenigmarchaeota archaeon]|nr:hypothetical protein [Candidatus Aenigmarchaeota archaeon]
MLKKKVVKNTQIKKLLPIAIIAIVAVAFVSIIVFADELGIDLTDPLGQFRMKVRGDNCRDYNYLAMGSFEFDNASKGNPRKTLTLGNDEFYGGIVCGKVKEKGKWKWKCIADKKIDSNTIEEGYCQRKGSKFQMVSKKLDCPEGWVANTQGDGALSCKGNKCEKKTDFKFGYCECQPDCGTRECGTDHCGELLCGDFDGECPGARESCNQETGVCDCTEPITCESLGRECGGPYSDGCGGTINCGTCDNPRSSCISGRCVCEPLTVADCLTRDIPMYCGSLLNGCGGTINCGNCDDGDICKKVTKPTGIQVYECVCANPLSCSGLGLECGTWSDDGCGGELDCGSCDDGYECVSNKCEKIPCVPNCDGKLCGDDGCGGSCGTCDSSAGFVCIGGQCECGVGMDIGGICCDPDCGDNECGMDPECGYLSCGGLSGDCPAGFNCISGDCLECKTCDDFIGTEVECGDDDFDNGCGGILPGCDSCSAVLGSDYSCNKLTGRCEFTCSSCIDYDDGAAACTERYYDDCVGAATDGGKYTQGFRVYDCDGNELSHTTTLCDGRCDIDSNQCVTRGNFVNIDDYLPKIIITDSSGGYIDEVFYTKEVALDYYRLFVDLSKAVLNPGMFDLEFLDGLDYRVQVLFERDTDVGFIDSDLRELRWFGGYYDPQLQNPGERCLSPDFTDCNLYYPYVDPGYLIDSQGIIEVYLKAVTTGGSSHNSNKITVVVWSS